MANGTVFLDGFTEEDIQWFFAVSTERQLAPGTALIEEGGEVRSFFIVLQGYLAVFIKSAGKGQIAALGQGETVGEMSFLEEKTAAASVVAVEETSVLELPFEEVERRIESVSAFGIRFFRSLSKLMSRRLRGRAVSTEHPVNPESGSERSVVDAERSDAWKKIKTDLQHFQTMLLAADEDAVANGKRLSPDGVALVQDAWKKLITAMNETVGPHSHENQLVKDEIGTFVQNALIGEVMRTAVMKRVYAKPRGNGGDCIALADIHSNLPGGSGPVGIELDRCFLKEPVCAAMRNRKIYIAETIRKLLAKSKEPLLVTCLSGGPADELFDVYQKMPRPDQLKSTIIDLDSQATLFLHGRREKLFLDSVMTIHNENVIYLSTGQSKLNIPPQDFVYSIGLIDYFEDSTVISLINFIHGILKPKGTLIIGNFHPDNPTRVFMDHVLDWKYVYRTPEDMQRLFQQSIFKRPPSRIRWDEQKIYLFAECDR